MGQHAQPVGKAPKLVEPSELVAERLDAEV
jgi:hypothetical protein